MAREFEKAEKRPGYDGTKEHPGRQVVDDLRAPGAMSRRLRGLGEAAAADAPAPAAAAPAGGSESRRGSGKRRPSITV